MTGASESDRVADGRLTDVLEALSRAGQLAAPVTHRPSVTALTDDSRRVMPGALFVALPGTRTDGHAYVADAVQRGAVMVLAERPVDAGVPVMLVRDARLGARIAARAWYRDPMSRLRLVGVTGTNGKTTTTTLLRHLLNAGNDTGSIGTLGAFDGTGEPVPSTAGTLTTPGPVDLHATFAALAARGVTRVAMEASSHSLHQGRLDGLLFAGAVFTNLTLDHLDYHGTMGEYRAAKLRLADLVAPGGVLAVNRDDAAWHGMAGQRGGLRTVGFGLRSPADLRAEGIVASAAGSRFRLAGRYGHREASLPLPGDFNVANALAAAALALGLGLTLDEVAGRLATAPQVPGRMECLAVRPCVVLRDYAHTPDALERVLRVLRDLTPGRLIVLFGCGGDRDRGKRPLMGRIAVELADLAIVTSDNPRTEDPGRIMDEIMEGTGGTGGRGGRGAGRVVRIVDRRAAIVHAIGLASAGDTLLLAGKGHETYQVIGTVRQPFDERAIVREMVEAGAGG